MKIVKKYQEEAASETRKADTMIAEQLESFRLAQAPNAGGGAGVSGALMEQLMAQVESIRESMQKEINDKVGVDPGQG